MDSVNLGVGQVDFRLGVKFVQVGVARHRTAAEPQAEARGTGDLSPDKTGDLSGAFQDIV